MIDYSRLKSDLLALLLLGGCVFLALCLYSYDPADPPTLSVYPVNAEIQNLCGPTGATIAAMLRSLFGLGAWLFLALVLLFDLRLFLESQSRDLLVRGLGALLIMTAVCAGLQIVMPDVGTGLVVGSGGELGAWGEIALASQFSTIGSGILLGTTLISGVLMTGETWILRLAWKMATLPGAILLWPFSESRPPDDAVKDAPTGADDDMLNEADLDDPLSVVSREPVPEEALHEDEEQPADDESEQPVFKVNPPAWMRSDRQHESRLPTRTRTESPSYELPSMELLEDGEEFPFELLAQKAQSAAMTLERTFEEFGLNVKVAEIDTGPVVTQFELELEPGLRLSKVVNLADDLAVALRVPAVRVVSPIPGKNTVGVEVPNDEQVMVRLREVFEACRNDVDGMRIPIFLGKDVSGRPLTVDLAKMPHLLIAGRTGTGKSVCLNTLILSMLMSRSPDDVRMLMIDPKMVELSPYMRIPHLMHPVITDMKKAEAVLSWAVDKMEERYDLLARTGVRHADGYNRLGRAKVLERLGLDEDDEEADNIPDRMPYIVIFADEMADMIMTSGKEVEGHIIRLAQKSRAVGIHLVLATQKPTVDVITGLIKSNLPARIAFQVASRTDSRVVLDELGAERLLGNGDLLYLAPGTSHLTRAQGTFVSDEEVNSVIDFLSRYEPQYSQEIAQATRSAAASGNGLDALRERDELYQQAVEVVIREGRGSVSLLQRALGIGYGRAARMVDYMAEDGIVGDYNGSKSREVLYTMEQWESFQSADEFADAGV